jgi:heparan-alpha-glucosaminide N-acetyltransferase
MNAESPAGSKVVAAGKQPFEGRLACLDAFRGFDILVMIFVNYIAGMAGIPFILRHAKAEMDAYTLTDLVFPGFLFIVGVAVPLSLIKRIRAGDSAFRLVERIGIRSAALVFLGVLMVNEESFSAAATGISKELWYFLAYGAVVVLWKMTPKTYPPGKRRLELAAKLAAGLVLLFLVVIFRGTTEAGTGVWLRPAWWGILGQIGWAYLLASLAYLLFSRDRHALMGFLGLLIAFCIGNSYGVLDFLGKGNPGDNFRGQLTCHSAIVLAGVLVGTLFAGGEKNIPNARRVKFMLPFGAGLYVSGLLLRPLHGISKIRATESYALVSAGICCILFLMFFLVMDVMKIRRWAGFLQPIGKNPLLAYILPAIVDGFLFLVSTIFGFNAGRLLWPFRDQGGLPGMLNALAVTGIILLITWGMTRAKIILKL